MKKNNVIKNSLIYSLSGILIKCFSLFLIPLYTAYLSTEEYGITNIVSRFITTMSFVVAFSLYSAIPRFYVEKKNKKNELSKFYGSITCFCYISGFLFLGLAIIFRKTLEKYVFAGISFFPIVFYCVVSLIFTCQHTIYDNILRAEQQATKCSLLSILYFICNVVLTIFLVVFQRKGAVGVVAATMITNFLFSCIFLIDMMKNKKIILCLDTIQLKEALKYSIPILPHNLSTRIAGLFSAVFLGNTNSLSVLGVYSLALQFGNVADAIQTYVNYAYCPWLFTILTEAEKGYKDTVRNVSNILSEVVGLFMIGIALFAPDYVFIFLKNSYRSGWYYIPLIVVEYVIKIMYYFYISALLYNKNSTKRIFIATLSSSIVNLFLSALLIPRFGSIGAIISDTIGVLLLSTLVYILYKKDNDVGLVIFDFIISFFTISVIICVGIIPIIIVKQNSFKISIFIYKIIIVVVYVLFCVRKNGKSIISTIKAVIGRSK